MGADTILKTFPLSYTADLKLLDDKGKNPLHWPVQILNVAVEDLEALGRALLADSNLFQVDIRS